MLKFQLFIFTIIIAFCNSCKPKSNFIETKVDIGTHTLNFSIIQGNGIPIVFESGSSDVASVWAPLISSLYPKLQTTMITYDRAGYGNSESNPNLPDNEKGYVLNTVLDLEEALKVLNINEEIIYVAHSYGGFIAAVFAERNPEFVKGIVLIDANLKCFFTDEIISKYRAISTDSILSSLKEQYGIGWYHEQSASDETLNLFRRTSYPIEIPIVDLVAENLALPFESTFEKWRSCHREFAEENENWKSYLSKGCGHYIFRDDPNMVNQKIIELYNKIDNPN